MSRTAYNPLSNLTVPVTPQNGGTGVANNAANTITFTGAFSLGLTLSGNTALTAPTSGTIVVNGANTNLTSITGLTGNVTTTSGNFFSATGKIGIGTTSISNAEVYAQFINTTQTRNNVQVAGSGGGGLILVAAGNSAYMASNAYYDGTDWRALTTSAAAFFGAVASGAIEFYYAPSVTAGNAFALVNAFSISTSQNVTIYGGLSMPKTITPGGTTGAQTIDKPTGSVNFAAGATSLVVTNNLCTTNSVISLTLAANDATAAGLRYSPGNGSFTIRFTTGPGAEARVDWRLTN